MRNFKILVSLLGFPIAAFGFTGFASAQANPDVQLGSNIPVRPEKPDPARDGAVRDNYVRCTYAPNQEKVDSLLAASDPMTADLKAAGIDSKFFRRHTLRTCFVAEGEEVQTSIGFTGPTFRYLMLEAAYRSKFPDLPVDHAGRVAPIRGYVSTGDALARAKSLGAFSDCLALKDPVGADRLLRTSSGTKIEREAAMALVPALSACMLAGLQLQLTPANIRSFAADGMWQRFAAKPNS